MIIKVKDERGFALALIEVVDGEVSRVNTSDDIVVDIRTDKQMIQDYLGYEPKHLKAEVRDEQ